MKKLQMIIAISIISLVSSMTALAQTPTFTLSVAGNMAEKPEVKAGESLEITYVLENRDNKGKETLNIEAYPINYAPNDAGHRTGVPAEWISLRGNTVFQLDPLEKKEFIVSVAIPKSAAKGIYQADIRAILTSYQNKAKSGDAGVAMNAAVSAGYRFEIGDKNASIESSNEEKSGSGIPAWSYYAFGAVILAGGTTMYLRRNS